MVGARTLSGNDLVEALRDSRAVMLSRIEDLDDRQWLPPRQAGVNPVAWEAAHVAWFAEFWILRGPHRIEASGPVQAARPARWTGPDQHFDSSQLPHAARWAIELPSRERLKAMLRDQLDACLAAMPTDGDDSSLYFHRLALFHEDMHAEAFAWMRATMGYAAPMASALPRVQGGGALAMPSEEVRVGWPAGQAGFAFDNESPSQDVRVPAFEIDAAPVTAGQFARFVEAGGYEDPSFWPGAAGAWRAQSGLPHPQRWRRKRSRSGHADWELRWFDAWLDLDESRPVIHVNAWEAEAYCRWARRRLPTHAEWERSALAAGPSGRFHWGHSVWEWTADAFLPYEGFRPGPYKDYSAPWFGDHRELRGGAFATHERMHDPRYRNFFEPHRTDVFAGLRTACDA